MHTLLRRGTVWLPLLALVVVLGLASPTRGTEAGNGPYALSSSSNSKWMDISSTGMLLEDLVDEDDAYQSDVPIGFTFTFNGEDYTALEVVTNGVISLDQVNEDDFDNETLPTFAYPGATLFPWWDDLYPPASGLIYAQTLGTAPNRVFIVQWDQITHIDSEDAAYVVSFEAALCEGNDNIVFQYLDTVFGDPAEPDNDEGGSATVGIQDATKGPDDFALQYSSESPDLSDGQAIVFYPTGGSADNCVFGLNEATPTSTPPPTPVDHPQPPTPTQTPGGGVELTVEDGTVTAGGEVDVTATVVNESGDPLAGVDCTFSIFSQPGNTATVDAGPVTTGADGTATTTLHAGNTPGTVEVRAECGQFTDVLEVTVSPSLPGTGAATSSDGMSSWLIALLAGAATLATAGCAALRLRTRRV